MNSTNLITALTDPNLYGDCLLAPFKLSVQAFQHTFSRWPVTRSVDEKIVEILKKTFFLTASTIGFFPAIPIALAGMAAKWIDFGLHMDQLVHKGSAIGSHLPLILKLSSRLGDRTVAYLNTKYVAEKYDLPVYFLPFKGCENFKFSQEETFTGAQYFKKIVHLKSAEEIKNLAYVDKTESVLYQLPFFVHTRNLKEETFGCSYINYETDWASFRERVGDLLTVIKPHILINIPENAYSIALHIRDGGDYDDDKTKTLHPLKLPPMNFYLGELKRVLMSDQLPLEGSVFIHIFTDALEPQKVYDEVQESLSGFDLHGREIKLSYCEQASLTDDIANMSRFQCMIRADSNLSGPIVEGSKTVQMDIFPTHFKIDAEWKEISISRVRIVTHQDVANVETDYPKKVVTGGLPRWFFQKFHDYYGVIRSES
jgi:hypothetical protein